ncbi:WD domain containing protein [Metarhizium anisopliae]
MSKNGRKRYSIGVRSQYVFMSFKRPPLWPHCSSPIFANRHWQLRSLISAEKKNIVYFPGGNGSNHVQRLNTLTRECETIKLLTFAPRCLVAENGWLCCGSENGEFVAIKLEDAIESNQQPLLGLHLDAETRHQLNLGGASRDEPLLALLAHARRSSKSLIAKSMKLAKDRVNCVTLWFPPALTPLEAGSYTEPVAVLANNDRTVVLVSLREFDQNEKIDPLDVVTYPDFVNRAILSPDGRILVAILDDPYLYVHERVETEGGISTPPASEDSGYRWEQRQRFLLKSQRKDDRSDSRGSFAACFSPSGAYLAVGTQHGTISIFDATLLLDPSAEPLITTFKSSRPESGPGAIRDMAFCPGPFDILAWTEDKGHIGFADMRSNFIIRQIVDINVEADFRHIDILDRNTVDPRLLDGNSDRRSNRSPPSGSTRTRRQGEALETLNQPLTPNETVVLEAIQGDRRRRERAALRSTEERARDGGPSDLALTYLSSLRPSAADGESPRPRQRSSSVGRAMGDILGSYREQRERQQERLRNARQLTREGSEGQQPQSTSARRTDQRWSEQRWVDRVEETVAAMRGQRERQDSSYLNVLEILQARERPSNDTDNEDSSLLVPLVNQVVNRWEESAIRGTLATDHGVFEVPPSPDNTAGLAWTEDGRTL